jgi:hypothetical protein
VAHLPGNRYLVPGSPGQAVAGALRTSYADPYLVEYVPPASLLITVLEAGEAPPPEERAAGWRVASAPGALGGRW